MPKIPKKKVVTEKQDNTNMNKQTTTEHMDIDNRQHEDDEVMIYDPLTDWHQHMAPTQWHHSDTTFPIEFGNFANTSQAGQDTNISQILQSPPAQTTTQIQAQASGPHNGARPKDPMLTRSQTQTSEQTQANTHMMQTFTFAQGLYSGPNYRAQQLQAPQPQAPQPQAPQPQAPQPQAPQPQAPQPQTPQPQAPQPQAPQPQAPHPQAPQPQAPQPQAPQAPQPQAPQPQAPQPVAPQAQHAQIPVVQGYHGPTYAYHGPQAQGQDHQYNYRGHRGHRGFRGHRGHPYRGAHGGVVHPRHIRNFDKVRAAIRESDDFGRTDRLTAEAEKKIDYNVYGKWLDRRTRLDRSTMNTVDLSSPDKRPEDRFLNDPRQLNKLDTKVTETIFSDFNNQQDPIGYTFLNKYYSALKVPFSKETVNKQNCVCGKESIGTLRQTVGHLGTHSHMHMGRVRCILCLTNGGEPKIFDTPDALFRHITNAHERALFSTHIQADFPTPNGADLFLLGYGQLLVSYTLGELARQGYLSNKFWESG